jgi:hypothetical protein
MVPPGRFVERNFIPNDYVKCRSKSAPVLSLLTTSEVVVDNIHKETHALREHMSLFFTLFFIVLRGMDFFTVSPLDSTIIT